MSAVIDSFRSLRAWGEKHGLRRLHPDVPGQSRPELAWNAHLEELHRVHCQEMLVQFKRAPPDQVDWQIHLLAAVRDAEAAGIADWLEKQGLYDQANAIRLHTHREGS